MCNCKDWCACCPSCIDMGYACDDCKTACCRNCSDCLRECTGSCCGEIRCFQGGCSGADCGASCAGGCHAALRVFECCTKIPSAMGGLLLLVGLVYLYFLWSFMGEKAQQVNDSLATLRVAVDTAQTAVNNTLAIVGR